MLLTLLLTQGTAGPSNVTLTQDSRFDNGNQFFAATVTRGAVALTPARFDNTQTFYAATVTRGVVTLTAARYDNGQTFYAPTVGRGAVSLTASPVENTSVFYGPVVSQGGVTQSLTPARFDNANTLYAAAVGRGPVGLSPARYENGQAFYSATLTASRSLLAARFDNTQTFYAPTVGAAGGTQTITFPNWVDPGWVEPGWVEWPYFNQNQFFAAEVTQGTPQSRAGFEMGGPTPRKVYIKRGKRIHIFDTVEEADAWAEAEQKALEAIAKASTTAKASQKKKAKVFKALDEQVPHEVIRLDVLQTMVAHFGIPVELPTLEAKQDWLEVARVAMLAQQMQDDEEVELLLMA